MCASLQGDASIFSRQFHAHASSSREGHGFCTASDLSIADWSASLRNITADQDRSNQDHKIKIKIDSIKHDDEIDTIKILVDQELPWISSRRRWWKVAERRSTQILFKGHRAWWLDLVCFFDVEKSVHQRSEHRSVRDLTERSTSARSIQVTTRDHGRSQFPIESQEIIGDLDHDKDHVDEDDGDDGWIV